MNNLVDIRALVHGTVQGVGFRATVRHHAQQLGLVGTVRNMPDGSVEICARGSKAAIDRLFAILQEEEFPRHITELKIASEPLSQSVTSFQIT